MQEAILIRGRLTGPKSVESDEPVTDLEAEIEVIVRSGHTVGQGSQLGLGLLRNIPTGTRSRQEIDRQLNDERESWGECWTNM